MRIHWIQHVPFEGLGQIETWAQERRHPLTSTRVYAQEPLPKENTYDTLIVMGGPMGANDDARFSWMAEEKRSIERAIRVGKNVLGICLGAQLIAGVLGARVYPNALKEIGWWPIELNPPNVRQHALNVMPQRSTVFHWHGDTFDLPKGARHLARSQACENQAVAFAPKVTGLQFHLELATPNIESLLRHASDDMTPGPFVQEGSEIISGAENSLRR